MRVCTFKTTPFTIKASPFFFLEEGKRKKRKKIVDYFFASIEKFLKPQHCVLDWMMLMNFFSLFLRELLFSLSHLSSKINSRKMAYDCDDAVAVDDERW
jgi:hypothetical protein